MAKSRTIENEIEPQLARVLLSRFLLENNFADVHSSVTVTVSKEFSVESYLPSEDGLARVLTSVKITIKGQLNNPKKIVLNLEAEYSGRYVFPPGTSAKSVDDYIAKEANKNLLAAQVNSVAMSHIKQQLEFSGLSTKSIHLSL